MLYNNNVPEKKQSESFIFQPQTHLCGVAHTQAINIFMYLVQNVPPCCSITYRNYRTSPTCKNKIFLAWNILNIY